MQVEEKKLDEELEMQVTSMFFDKEEIIDKKITIKILDLVYIEKRPYLKFLYADEEQLIRIPNKEFNKLLLKYGNKKSDLIEKEININGISGEWQGTKGVTIEIECL